MSTPHTNIRIIPAQDIPQIWGLNVEDRTCRQIDKAKLAPPGQLLLRADTVYDTAVLKGLTEKSGTLLINENKEPLAAHVPASQTENAENWLTGNSGKPPENTQTLTPAEAGGAYNLMLRKAVPLQCHIVNKDNASDIEWKLYLASYKGVTDLITKYLWPVPAYHATRFCAKLNISPNMVTSVGAILTLLTLWLFWEGHYGWGLLAGWIMTFLDTVDGKLARCTLTSSKWGNIFDHGIDLLHPPFWYIAWIFGLEAHGYMVFGLETIIWIIFLSYIGGRLIEGYFIWRFGFHIHVWRRFDSFFRLIVARRNPNMIFLTLSWLVGRPDLGLLAVIIWTVLSVPIHIVQTLQAEIAHIRGKNVTSWLSA